MSVRFWPIADLLAFSGWMTSRHSHLMQTKTYIVRVALYIAAIVVVAWPLQLARPEIGDMAYVVSTAVVLGAFYWLGRLITKQMNKPHPPRGSV